MTTGKTLLAFGFYDRASPHFLTVRDAFIKDGWTMAETWTDAKGATRKTRELLEKWREKPRDTQAVLVPFPGHHLMPLAWLLTRIPRRKLIFEAFISLYDTNVIDRGIVQKGSIRARMLWLIDWMACRMADEIILDTEEHKNYFCGEFGVKPEKIRVIYVEPRKDLIRPHQKIERSTFEVFFYGTYIPLQGIDCILDAAAIVMPRDPKVHFTLVGGGQTLQAMRKRAEDLKLTNVTFEPFLPLSDLLRRLSEADLALGIFGTTPKSARVIPHKVIDAVAAGVPVITRDSPAIRERYADHPGVMLCPAGDPRALAHAILESKSAIRN